MKVNLAKCSMAGINVDDATLQHLAGLVGCEVAHWPFSYLGMPLGGNPRSASFWDPVLASVSRRLDGWKRAYFSLGGRITLLRSCLSNIPLYFLSVFRIPASIANQLEKLMRDFLWEGTNGTGSHLVSWDLVCRPKSEGGLGLGRLAVRNKALLGKWLWRFPKEVGSLWYRVICSKYGLHSNGWDSGPPIRATRCCPWKSIMQLYPIFIPLVRCRLGDGSRVRFWEDDWCEGLPLLNRFPRLFSLSRYQGEPISHFFQVSSEGWDFGFRRDLLPREFEELTILLQLLDGVRFDEGSDRRIWIGDTSGTFSSKSFFSVLSAPSTHPVFPVASFLWKTKAPTKVRAFAWVLSLGRLNTNDMRQRRAPGIALSPDVCVLCYSSNETSEHLFLHCPYARRVWSLFFGVKEETFVLPLMVISFLQTRFTGFGPSKEGKMLWRMGILAIFWCLWLQRNVRVFPDREDLIVSPDQLWEKITFLASLWAKAAGGFRGYSLSTLQHNWHAL